MSLPKTLPMRAANGATIDVPSVGYGTWASGEKSWCEDATRTALEAGYRHIDGAWAYGVDAQVGKAIRESGVPREEIFYTTKAVPQFMHPDNVEICLDKVLQETGLEYVDLFLAHWPVSFVPRSKDALQNASAESATDNVKQGFDKKADKPIMDWANVSGPIARKAGHEGSFLPTWQAMQALVKKGKARAVGVSNFSIADLEEILPHSKDVPVSCNQVEVHPWLPQTELLAFCKKNGILMTCYSPFAGQKDDGATLLKDKEVLRLAEKNGMDVGQLLQSWAVQRGTVPLGKSATPSRIKSNLDVRKLSDEDFAALDALALPNDEGRTINPSSGWDVTLF